MPKNLLLFALVMVLLSIGYGCSDSSGSKKSKLEAGDHYLTIEHDGKERECILVVPEPATTGTNTPLVVSLHGYTGDMDSQRYSTTQDPDENFEAYGYIVAYVNGTGTTGVDRSWNAGGCCGEVSDGYEDPDDVGFIRALVEKVSEQVYVDESRIYAFGTATGGFLANRLACEAGDLFAAVGSVLGTFFLESEQCHPSRPVPVILINGTEDILVPYEGGVSDVGPLEIEYPHSLPEVFEIWAQKNGCQGNSIITEKVGDTTCETYIDCDGEVEVTLCAVGGMGHCWPGQPTCGSTDIDFDFGEPSTDINANKKLREFFEHFSL